MFTNPSLITRIAYGKLTGLVFAGLGIFIVPQLFPDLTWLMLVAFLLYYITLGAIIGLVGVLNYHPMINLPLRWWLRGPLIGAWMNFILTLFIFDKMAGMMTQAFGAGSILSSPWWFVLEGALFGLLVDFICTKFAGEGAETVK
jgi:hypothetical protein